MSSIPAAQPKVDVSNSLAVAATSVIAVVVAGLICSALKLPESATQSMTAIATGLPAVALLSWRRYKTTGRERAAAIAVGDLGASPIVVVLVVASLLALTETVLGALGGAVAGVTSSAAAQFGASPAIQQQMLASGIAFHSTFIVIPLMLVVAFFAGRTAGHYLKRRKFLWLLVAATLYLAIRVMVVLLASGFLFAQGFEIGALPLVATYVALALALALAMFGGTLWSRRRHEVFVGYRLLAQLKPDDRHAMLDLLRSSARSL